MIALIVVALGAVAAAVGTGVLAARAAQLPRVYVVVWTAALFGLAVGLAAATLGFLAGYGDLIFRVMELGVGLIAPACLCLALVELTGQRLGSRFAMRLAISGIGVIALVILGTDPINPNATFSTSWANPADFYQLAPVTVLDFIALFTAVTAVAALAMVLRRSSKEGLPREETRPVILLAVAALIVVIPGLAALLNSAAGIKLPLPPEDLFAVSALAAACVGWYAAKVAGGADLSQAQQRNRRDAGDERDGGSQRRREPDSYRGYETGEFDYLGDDQYQGGRPGDGYGNFGGEPNSEIRYPALAALAADPAEPAEQPGLYRDERGRFDEPFDERGRLPESGWYDGRGQFDEPGEPQAFGGDHGRQPDWEDYPDERSEPRGDLFGQITIYTLIEGRVDEFDRLTERVVELVREREPGTLVYIVHAVPTAPLQRILYEVYRDRGAHEDHLRCGYVLTYEADQRPFVLATNVIELGLQQAKISPLPSESAISDILSESGIDLTGVTNSAQRGFSRPGHRRPERQRQPGHQPRPDYPHGPDYQDGAQYQHGPGPQHGPEYQHDPERQHDPEHQHGPGYEPRYQGWADIRGEDSRY